MGLKEQVQHYLDQMTVDEKIDQMLAREIEKLQRDFKNGKAEHVYGFYHSVYSLSVEELQELKVFAQNQSKSRIPIIVTGESLHGIMHGNATIFPQSIAMGATFNKRLMARVADVIGEETKALGIDQVFAPDLDLARDPRWGRTEECYSEDPYLNGEYGKVYVEGLQKHNVAATLKHFVAHGAPEGGLNEAPPHVGERELREYFLPPFEAAVQSGAMSVMPAYNELDGIPMHASKEWLNDYLREEQGFDGVILSDFDGVARVHTAHKCTRNRLETGKVALEASVDVEAPYEFGYGEDFRKAVKSGEIDIAQIDQAVGRILEMKMKLGLLDVKGEGQEQQTPPIGKTEELPLHTQQAVDLALEAAQESIVLLKNEGQLLPLKENVKKVALIGFGTEDLQFGDYTAYHSLKDIYTTPRQAFEAHFGRENVLYSLGCGINSCSDEELKQAQETARQADVAVVFLGDNSKFFGGRGWGVAGGDTTITSGENYDISELTLPLAQRKLLKGIIATGVPVVLVLNTGRVYSLEGEVLPDAILQMFYAGEKGAEALADIVTGKISPSGRLPISIPKTAGHIPCYYNYKPSARGPFDNVAGSEEKPAQCYVFSSPEPWYPFGYGLSYGKILYEELRAETTDSGVKVQVTVQNDSEYSVKEAILLFDRVDYCEVTQPVKRLCEFEKITLEPGESRKVELFLPYERFWYINKKMQKARLCGVHTITVDGLSCEVTIY